jgi:hypothetical protein
MRRIGGSLEGVSVVMGGSAGFTARVLALGWGEVVVVVAMVVVTRLANSGRKSQGKRISGRREVERRR